MTKSPIQFHLVSVLVAGLLILGPMTGCRTAPPQAPFNTAEPGWRLREGQALWRTSRTAPEMAGEIVVATHPDGRAFLQFSKTPLPFVSAQCSGDRWQIDFIPEHRTLTGQGEPSLRLFWLHVLRALGGNPPPPPLELRALENHGWRLSNPSNGESVDAYLNP